MTEPEVIERVRSFLLDTRFPEETSVQHLCTDAHHTLVEHGGLGPYQRVSMPYADEIMHPDLVGQLSDGESLFAVEAKGEGDLVKGIGQAERYQEGVQRSFFALPADRFTSAIERMAAQKNVGLLTVAEEVTPLYWPRPRQPWQTAYRSVWRQIDTGLRAQGWSTFTYNLPTHYLAWTLALDPEMLHATGSVKDVIAPYHRMPKDWKAALRGAKKLGLVRRHGNTVELTPTGCAVRDILDTSLEEWNDIHKRAIYKPLADVFPRAGAALRILLLREPEVRLLVRALRQFDDKEAAMPKLAKTCDSIDHDRTPALLFTPERIDSMMDKAGRILWDQVDGMHYRSTTFYQMKRILQHAGILEDTGLQSNSAKSYKPAEDHWALRMH
ncbi:hypothetical protein CRI94_04430 [Longibacter salinarum]|uniref:Uncharacterized protein n=1 Tax=Longibacter salinarum TaxID=1850348 RepID=A0A2A8D0B0_9BACT|nr:hypothetical protein [Longibacter salinarum]PEN14291.1 hypothetical protein CRI94_04430 [Longibacter salinarum]